MHMVALLGDSKQMVSLRWRWRRNDMPSADGHFGSFRYLGGTDNYSK